MQTLRKIFPLFQVFVHLSPFHISKYTTARVR